MGTLTLSKEDSRDAVYDNLKGFSLIKTILIGNSRWSTIHTAVIKRDIDGAMFMIDYDWGATEHQEESPFEYSGDSIEWTQCVVAKKKKKVYRAATDDDQAPPATMPDGEEKEFIRKAIAAKGEEALASLRLASSYPCKLIRRYQKHRRALVAYLGAEDLVV